MYFSAHCPGHGLFTRNRKGTDMDTILYNEDIQFPEAFPAKHSYENRINSNPFLALHWHKACEIVYVESGSYVCTIGGTRYAASQGDILFVNSCVPHDRIFYSGRYDVMVFDPMRIFMGASGQTTPDAGLQIFTTFPKEDFGLRKYASEFCGCSARIALYSPRAISYSPLASKIAPCSMRGSAAKEVPNENASARAVAATESLMFIRSNIAIFIMAIAVLTRIYRKRPPKRP